MGNFWSSPPSAPVVTTKHPRKPKTTLQRGGTGKHGRSPSPLPSGLPVGFLNNAACPFSPTPPLSQDKNKRFKDTDEEYIQLPCEVSGGFSCFVCMDNAGTMRKEWEENILSIEMYSIDETKSEPTKTIEEKEEILTFLNFLNPKEVCFKAFKKNNDDLIIFNDEVKSARHLREALGEKLFQSHTTYRMYENSIGFAIHFKKPVWVGTLQEKKETRVPSSRRSHIYIIPFQKCQSDLCIFTIHKNTIALQSFLDCLHPVMRALHSKGFIHADVKPSNIVYCDRDPVPYKLIDFGDVEEKDIAQRYRTVQYSLPTLPLDAQEKKIIDEYLEGISVFKLPNSIYNKSKENCDNHQPPFTKEETYRLHDLYGIVQTIADLRFALNMDEDTFMENKIIQEMLSNPDYFMTLPSPKTKAPSIRKTDGTEGTYGGRKQRKRRSKKI